MVKMLVFDMDGTIADLYGVIDWLPMLRAEDPTPYLIANPLVNMRRLNNLLSQAQSYGIEVQVVSWLSKESTEEYKDLVREAKKAWLKRMGFNYDHFHGIQYGANKPDAVRRKLSANDEAILFDDDAKVRKTWHLGEAVNPMEIDICEYIEKLLEEM